jgi:hypothetical protein
VIDRTTRLSLARQVRLKLDPRSGKQMLLYPEKGLELNETAARVAALCTEERAVDDILARMVATAGEATAGEVTAGEATADNARARAKIEDEVLAFLRALEDRGLLVVHAP